LLALARGLRDRGHRQQIVSPEGSALESRARGDGFLVASVTNLPKLRRLLCGFDVIHAHTGRSQNLAFCATAGLKVRRVVTRHVAFAPNHPSVHRLKYTLTCHGIIAVSQAVRAALLGAGISGDRIQVISTGVEWPASLPNEEERRAIRSRWGFGDGDFVAGHLGAFTAEKGQDVAVAAAALLQPRMPQLRMVLAGDGPLRDSLRMNTPVLFPGHVSCRAEFLAALDLFIMPSRSEAWGLAALEAMAQGIPVVASRVGGLPEMIEANESGWLVAPGDAGELARAIERAASDREALRAMGARARARAKQFSLEETAERTEAFYQRLLA
jgi:glycosyltransferase involved in cell wall biosynthesis